MRIEFTIIILTIIVVSILAINKLLVISKIRNSIIVTSLLILAFGFCNKYYEIITWFDNRLLFVPIIQISIQLIFHKFFKLVFNTPFYLNIRGFEFPVELKTKENGFVRFLSFIFSLSIILIVLFLFFLVLD